MIELIFIGAIIGLISSLLGVSGGFLLVPALYYFYLSKNISPEIAIKMAIGTSLFIIFINSLFSLYFHKKKLDIKSSLLIGIFGVLGSIIGGYLTITLFPEYLIKKIFAFFLIALSIYMLKKKDIYANGNIEDIRDKLPFLGFITGLISSMLGIGGGILIIPSLNIVLNIPIKRAIKISIGVISIISFSGALVYLSYPLKEIDSLYNIGYVSLLTTFIVLPPCIIFSKVGNYLANKINTKYLKILLAIVIFIGGIKMIL